MKVTLTSFALVSAGYCLAFALAMAFETYLRRHDKGD